jgi:hypothetical protein
MKLLVLLVALLTLHPFPVVAQEITAPEGTVIRSAQVSGIDTDRLSPGLRADINALTGTGLNRERLRELAARIEAERPDMVTAVRAVDDAGNNLRVVFFVARLDTDATNINTRYTVESVELTGVSGDAVGQPLRDELQTLVGKPLDSDEAGRLQTQLKEALPGYDVNRTISRGSEPGRIKVVFKAEKGESLRWLHFEPLKSKGLFHSDQGWSWLLDLGIGSRDLRVTPRFALDNSDDLVEEYSGIGIRIEDRNIGTERFGLSLELAHYDSDWEEETLLALAAGPGIPGIYDSRTTVEPKVLFAITPRISVSGGVSIVELEPELDIADSTVANAVIAAVGYEQRWGAGDQIRRISANGGLRWGTDSLRSDLEYRRFFGSGSYDHEWGRNRLILNVLGGRINGDAPLFERFTLGDSVTLRGWDKFDIAPFGGDRVIHGSAEFRHRILTFFLDAGSVWNGDSEAEVRWSTGFGLRHEAAFFTVSFPLNTDDVRAVVALGFRL